MTNDEKRCLGFQYADYLIEKTSDMAVFNQLQLSLYNEFPSDSEDPAVTASKKRGLEDDTPLSANKMAKLDAAGISPAAANYAAYGAYGAYQVCLVFFFPYSLV
jgi:hypothetical protein